MHRWKLFILWSWRKQNFPDGTWTKLCRLVRRHCMMIPELKDTSSLDCIKFTNRVDTSLPTCFNVGHIWSWSLHIYYSWKMTETVLLFSSFSFQLNVTRKHLQENLCSGPFYFSYLFKAITYSVLHRSWAKSIWQNCDRILTFLLKAYA